MSNMDKVTHRVIFFLSLVLFKVSLDLSYTLFVSDVFGYSGFTYNFAIENYLFSWLIIIPFCFLVRDKLRGITDYTELFWFLLVLLPTVTLYGLDYQRSIVPSIIGTLSLFLFMFVVRVKLPNLKAVKPVKNGFSIGVLICTLFVVYLILNYLKSGVTLNLNFLKVYEYREQNSELSSGGIFTYFNIWTYKVFNIILISVSLFYKRYGLLAIFVCIQVFFFAASAHKSVLLMGMLVISIWYFFRKRSSLILLPTSLTFLICFSMLLYFYYGNITLASVFIRRLFFIPAYLNYEYIAFFSVNDFVFWSNSIMKWLLKYPYSDNIAHTIGIYIGNPGMGANNGIISSGYAQAGAIGVMIYACILACLLRFIQFLANGIYPPWFILSLFIVPISSVILNSDLFTTLSTHGFAVAILMLFLIRNSPNNRKGSI